MRWPRPSRDCAGPRCQERLQRPRRRSCARKRSGWIGLAELHLAPGVMPTVPDLGALLERLLSEHPDAGPVRLPPGLVILAARAMGRIDLAPFPSRDALAGALARFEPPDSDMC